MTLRDEVAQAIVDSSDSEEVRAFPHCAKSMADAAIAVFVKRLRESVADHPDTVTTYTPSRTLTIVADEIEAELQP